MPASARPCPPLAPLNLHGKEGIARSIPSRSYTTLWDATRFAPTCHAGGPKAASRVGDP
jgi:hypothetical protein